MFDFDRIIDRNGTGSIKCQRRTPEEARDNIVAMSVADMEFQVAPCVQAAVEAAARHGVYGYTDPDSALLRPLIAWMQTRHHTEVSEESVVSMCGVVPGLSYAVKAFTQPGDGVIIFTPVYMPFTDMVEVNRRTLVRVPLVNQDGRYSIDFDLFEQKASESRNRLLLFCSPHNPVGRVWTKEELRRVHEICERNHVLVVSDEIHADLTFAENFCYLREDPNAVVLVAPSKTFNIPGLQLAFAFIRDPALRGAFREAVNECGYSNISYFGYAASKAAYAEGAPWLDELLAYLRGNFEIFYDFMARRFPKAVVTRAEGTYLAWADFRAYFRDFEELRKFMRGEARLILDEGYFFGEEGRGFERFNLALPKTLLQDALQRLDDAATKRGF